MLLGCRNVLNEWGHQLRLGGQWWRRGGDPPVDCAWPVLAALPDGLRFLPADEAEKTAGDLLTIAQSVIHSAIYRHRLLGGHDGRRWSWSLPSNF